MPVGGIIVGAGASTRAGFDKVFALLAGQPVLAYSLRAFTDCPTVEAVVVVLSAGNLEQGRQLVAEGGWTKVTSVCLGGEQRQDSVAAGLARLAGCDWVAIHDAARPLVTPGLIERGVAEAAISGAAIAAVPVTDTIKMVGSDRTVESTPPRHRLWAVQTPQVFRHDLITAAYAAATGTFTDDAGLLEQLGYPVRVFEGSHDNIKITHARDLEMAEFLLRGHQCHE